MRYFLVWLALFALDFLSKQAALAWIPPLTVGAYPFGGIGIFPHFWGISFSLNRVLNTGGVWGLLTGHPTLFFWMRLIVIVALFLYVFVFRQQFPKWSFVLVAAGALGNLLDYLLYGAVVDFFYFRFAGWSFPVFNLADTYITLGALWLFFVKKRN